MISVFSDMECQNCGFAPELEGDMFIVYDFWCNSYIFHYCGVIYSFFFLVGHFSCPSPYLWKVWYDSIALSYSLRRDFFQKMHFMNRDAGYIVIYNHMVTNNLARTCVHKWRNDIGHNLFEHHQHIQVAVDEDSFIFNVQILLRYHFCCFLWNWDLWVFDSNFFKILKFVP